MACRSPEVKRAATKTKKATTAVDDLEKMLKGQEAAKKAEFFARIDDNFAQAGITDQKQIEYNMDIKTEYSHEFSLDAIAGVIESVLNAAAKTTAASAAPSPALTPAALEAYADVVNNVAEAARSSSQTSSSMSFSMNRIGRGVFAFLYATSISAEDRETFGNEAITSTAIFYRLMQSIDDAKNQVEFESALIYADNVLKSKRIQAALLDELADGKITYDVYLVRDAQMQLVVDRNQTRLDESGFEEREAAPTGGMPMMGAAPTMFGAGARDTASVAREALGRLSLDDPRARKVAETAKARLERDYF